MTAARLAVIPARGGSTRLKDKNIYPLAGKPLIGHTVEAVVASGCFDTVIVSTDSPAIAAAAQQFGKVQIYDRPAQYAGERITVVEALLAMMGELPRHDVFAYFLPTCPFRNAADIRAGVDLLDQGADFVISVSRYSEPPQLALIKHGDDILPVHDNLRAGVTNSKFLAPFYKPNGGFYLGRWDSILKHRNFYSGNVKGHELPKERSVDIDDLLDIRYAEEVWKMGREAKGGE